MCYLHVVYKICPNKSINSEVQAKLEHMSIEQLRNELQSMERQRQEKEIDLRIAIRKKDSGRIRDLRREIRGCNKVIAFINKQILEIEKKTSKPGHSNSDPTPEKTVEEEESDNTPDHWDSSAGEDDENDEDYEDNENDEDYEDYEDDDHNTCLLYTSPSPRDKRQSRMPSSA